MASPFALTEAAGGGCLRLAVSAKGEEVMARKLTLRLDTALVAKDQARS